LQAADFDPRQMPDGYDLVQRFDLRPLPPDQMVRQDAARWTEAEHLQQAIRQGTEDARMEKAVLDQPDDAYGQVG
jgi:hypothetical protein